LHRRCRLFYGISAPNGILYLLFDYQQQLRQSGHFEAYNYWLMSKGDEEAWKLWVDAHPTHWEEFICWFKGNPLQVMDENKFYRRQYL